MAGSDMTMILVVGAVLIGGFFLMQSGGLQGLMGGGAAAAPPVEAPKEGEGEEQPKEGEGQEGMEDDMSPYERYESRSPFGESFKYEQRGGPGFGGPPPFPVAQPYPVPVPIGGPYRGPPPFGPGPRPPFGYPGPHPPFPPGPPRPCAKWCFGPFASPGKCRQCKDAMGIKSYYGGCSCGS